ncbi:MAG: hypothetical protein U0163_01350 [Gemmatimonadaceae bacterium]
MSLRRFVVPIASLVLVLAACTVERDADRLVVTPASDHTIRDQDIEFYAKRLNEDPESAADRSRLAQLFLARARETGSSADVDRADSLATEALAMREAHNAATYGILASARMARHDFLGARLAARRLGAADPVSASSRALLGEIELELGNYADARVLFRALERESSQLSVASRLVRWYELTGRLDQARHMARYAAKRAKDEGTLSHEQIAWFEMRVGDLAFKSGDLVEADSAYARALAIFPEDYRVQASEARLAAARRDWRTAVAHGEAAVSIQLDPATLGLLADAWRALGDSLQAQSYERAMTTSALTQPGAIHRAWGLYLLDHHRQVDEVIRRARLEHRVRHDVYGDDLLAWALYSAGEPARAWTVMQRALAQGTEDALLAYHAATIARTLGLRDVADEQMARARSLNLAAVVRGNDLATPSAVEGR